MSAHADASSFKSKQFSTAASTALTTYFFCVLGSSGKVVPYRRESRRLAWANRLRTFRIVPFVDDGLLPLTRRLDVEAHTVGVPLIHPPLEAQVEINAGVVVT